jgi:hypothetical protein
MTTSHIMIFTSDHYQLLKEAKESQLILDSHPHLSYFSIPETFLLLRNKGTNDKNISMSLIFFVEFPFTLLV